MLSLIEIIYSLMLEGATNLMHHVDTQIAFVKTAGCIILLIISTLVLVAVHVAVMIFAVYIFKRIMHKEFISSKWKWHLDDLKKYNDVVTEYDKLRKGIDSSCSLKEYKEFHSWCVSKHLLVGELPEKEKDVAKAVRNLPVYHTYGDKLTYCDVPYYYACVFDPTRYSRHIKYKTFDGLCTGCFLVALSKGLVFLFGYAALAIPTLLLLYS